MGDLAACEHCSRQFSYKLIHNGFNDSAYAYCDTCGCTAMLSAWAPHPDDATVEFHRAITRDLEPFLEACQCGGRFSAGASPRCPHCLQPLSASSLAATIEGNAPGTAKGWKWQETWSGLYCIIVAGKVREDPWSNKPNPI